MAGVKQFDQDDVLDRAMRVFWERGYEATSIQDVVEATGINRGSLYATFNDKKQLFLAVLTHYANRVGAPMMAELTDPDPRQAIERLFAAILRRTGDPTKPRGCLITNTALECPRSGDDISRTIAAWVGQQESMFYQVLLNAQATGALPRAHDCRALARFFVGVAQGLNVVHKAMADPIVLQDIVRVAMQVWDAPHTLLSHGRSRQRHKRVRRLQHERVSSKRPLNQQRGKS
jgi:TetR/AcrR family transcriptional regulator, transcriptional repressor for nem operon